MQALMENMGFNPRWIGWLMKCVTSTSYQVLLNGTAKGRISLSTGISQRDFIAPYLFILCTEFLVA